MSNAIPPECLLPLTVTTANYVATLKASIFLLEALLKMVGFGVAGYFRDYWNIFDFAVVARCSFSNRIVHSRSAFEFHAFALFEALEALPRVCPMAFLLGCPTLLPVDTVRSVQTLKVSSIVGFGVDMTAGTTLSQWSDTSGGGSAAAARSLRPCGRS